RSVGDHAAVHVADDLLDHGIVQTQNGRSEERDAVRVLREGRLDVFDVTVGVEVLLFDAGDDGEHGGKPQERPVVFVGFDDDDVAFADHRVGQIGRAHV